MLPLVTLTCSVAAAEPIVTYDMTPLFSLDLNDEAQRRRFWDETHLVTSLQGLVNRDEARLYVRYNADADDFWWERMTEEGGWLDGREVEQIESLEALLERFSDCYEGAVVWDERVPATSNLASTIAGVEGLLCVRQDDDPGSVCQELGLPEKARLIGEDGAPMFTGEGTIAGTDLASTGSAKCDAYRWLIEKYVRTGKANPKKMGYYLDGFWLKCWMAGAPQNCTVTNQDYVIAHGGILFDLNVWDDEATVDDPDQPPGTDADTLRELLRAAWDQFGGDGCIHVAGFTPWAYKYTDFANANWSAGGKYGGVPTEWKYAEILSCFNAYMDADALGYSAMANASFYQHYPVPKRVKQNPKPTVKSLKARGILDESGRIVPRHYYAHYVGDYDAAAWLYQRMPHIWTDEKRGEVPLSWAFNPNLSERFPLGMMWTRDTRTENDFFVAGDSGAGYLNPGFLSEPRPHSGLPSGLDAWEKHCKAMFDKWDISLTGFVIDGFARGLTEEGLEAYSRFSRDGIVPQKIDPQGLVGKMPFIRMGGDLPHDPAQAAQVIGTRFGRDETGFAVYRSILKQPSWYVAVEEAVQALPGDDEIMVVDLYTLLWLVREFEAHPKRYAPPPSPHANAKQIQATPSEEQGLAPVGSGDGQFELVEAEGETCWLLPGRRPMGYLYFDVDDQFLATSGGTDVVLEVELRGKGAAALVEYDSADLAAPHSGAYTLTEATEVEELEGGWSRVTYPLNGARFRGSQNSEADFRIVGKAQDVVVRRVMVRRTATDKEN